MARGTVAVVMVAVVMVAAVAVTWEVAADISVAADMLAVLAEATQEALAADIPVDSAGGIRAALAAATREAFTAEEPRPRSRMEWVAEVLRDPFRKLPHFITHLRAAIKRSVADSKESAVGKLREFPLRPFINQERGTLPFLTEVADSLAQRNIIREPLRRSAVETMPLTIPGLLSDISRASQRTAVR
jgi:hypothetical protein